ncbi:MAG TPA: signal recognition particle-docking protein FtsY [Flexistipes sinusarabici]|uniref:Signal recognition particle receptor FtsY n=1 Tax=Flexistipes sinusarabici TaxID=2352 RepID=A0A3D5QB78_FLESI|nr:signal recognition particle-docking protein FtsY [Flexistipes sinusarabici]
MGFFDVFKRKKREEKDKENIREDDEEVIEEKEQEETGESEGVSDSESDSVSDSESESVSVTESGSEKEGQIKESAGDEKDDKSGRKEDKEKKSGVFGRLKKGISKTSGRIIGGMETIFLGKKEIDEELLDELEELFVTSDIGVSTTMKIIDDLRNDVSRKILKNPQQLKNALKQKLTEILDIDNELVKTDDKPYVILVTGVNGAGKTTSIAKLAKMFKENGMSVMLAAGDTFRAAAIEQLEIWGERAGVPVVKQKAGSDSAAVVYDAVLSAKSKKIDVVIADTAGRLHTKDNLMNELKKISRVVKKEMPDAPHEVLLVLDATSGQNAVAQAKTFGTEIGVTGVILTKLDGTAKGGVIVGIVDEMQLPVKFIGFGESMDDLKPFDAGEFVEALFESADETDYS